MNLSIPRRRNSAASHRLTFPFSHLLLVGFTQLSNLLPLRVGERAGVRCFLLFALLTQLSTFNSQLSAATFTNNVTLTETNNTYDGQDIVISGATVTIDGPHSFNSLLLTNGAVLTHLPCTATETHKLNLAVTNAIVVSTNSRIDVSGKGYLAGRTSGNTTNGASTQFSGGSYGGMGGGYSGGLANRVYGDYADPQRLGKWRKCGGYRGRTGEIGRRDFAVGWTGCGRWKFRLLL